MSTDHEAVNHPSYYGGDTTYEVIKVCEAWDLDKDAYLFQVVKYVSRAGIKNPDKEIEDLEKAEFYLRRKIDRLKQEANQGDTSASSPSLGNELADLGDTIT